MDQFPVIAMALNSSCEGEILNSTISRLKYPQSSSWFYIFLGPFTVRVVRIERILPTLGTF